ncbi:zinc-binding alcohol dehydrogenase family protein [Lewinella sp. JB7]|uniref:zinc-binding alcohol dehydrogenase family protein n=1 Tax=Lewinella sp. JB7 TaxID=2962887 RepID=UPI0020C9E9D0|nr:zinc-binding alcohol dehydrogenase family protein [Lewinella sp. JB7]MCP9235836.1 zinc-binding alcohol dehydrogenase family protein [Lewinella sp. JB7]
MKYIVCQEPGRFELGDRPEPAAKSGEALLKIHRVGICGTDLHAYSGNQAFFTYPRILGHELSAEVVEIGQNSQGLTAGDRVIIMPYLSCGKCVACRMGKTNCCQNIRVLGVHTDGGMQEYITVPTNVLIPAGNLSHDEIAIVEPLAIGAHALRRAGVEQGETIVVVGCGPIGIGLMALAKLVGCTVVALDTNQQRLDFVRDEIGVDHAFSVLEDPVTAVAEVTGGDLATAVFDATGAQRALESGIDYMSHGGRYVLVGLSKGELTFNHPKIHAKETTLMCSRNATFDDFRWVKESLESGKFPTDKFITHSVSFTDMIERFDGWLKPESGVIKAVVTWE